MYHYIVFTFLWLFPVLLSAQNSALQVTKLLCEHRNNPLGIEEPHPKLSWQMQSEERGQYQTAYRILVADDPVKLENEEGIIWDSQKIQSDQSIGTAYHGPKLSSAHQYFWKVKVWDKEGNPSPWSKINHWQMGLLDASAWGNAQWIGYSRMDTAHRILPGIHAPGHHKEYKNRVSGDHVLPILRKEFQVVKPVKKATLFVSGLGHYEMSLNGEKVGDRFLAPGWTDYEQHCLYNTYDITDSLKVGPNVMGVWLGNGFYNVPNERYRKLLIAYGHPKMILQLLIEHSDGSKTTVVSDTTWKTSRSPITFSSIYGGENYEATLEQKGWNQPGFDDTPWKNAILANTPKGKLREERDHPVKVVDTLHPQKIYPLEDGNFLYDFGQNASGIVELTVKGKKGQMIKLIPAELIRENKQVNQSATGKPYYFTYTLKGDGVEVWKPRFTYYGFRYVQVEGAMPDTMERTNDLPRIEQLTLLHTRNAAPKTGTFACSDTLLNQVFQLIHWAIKSNLQSVVTDCPHREKLGWMEQTYLMGGAIHYNFELYGLYSKLVDDMIYAQTPAGLVPAIAPEYVDFGGDFRDSPEWGSASVILPWLVYQWYGDRRVMKKAWPMMERYVAYLESKADHHILSHGLGDWYDLGPERPGYAQLTPKALTATAIYYYDVTLLSRMANLLGHDEQAKYYTQLAAEIKTAFNNKFFDEQQHVYATGSQTAMSMPWAVGLVEEPYREAVLNKLISTIRQSGKVLTAGDIGFHFLVETLSDGGASELLYEMNARADVPGYGYQLKKGATALTESWQALEVVSNNHLMLGHLMQWFYEGLAGIRQAENAIAYKEIMLKPEPVGNISQAKASFDTPYGTVRSSWEKQQDTFTLNVSIPVNTSALIYLPATEKDNIEENGKPLKKVKDLQLMGYEEGKAIIQAGSGHYRLTVRQ